MASRKWVTDRTIDMLPVGVEDNSPYGWDLFNIYEKHFDGLRKLFRDGITGCCLDAKEPLSTDHVISTISSGLFSIPQDWHKSELPKISGTQWVEAYFKMPRPVSMRHYRCVRLQGDFARLLEDSKNEGCGTMAVAALHTLAREGFFPCDRESSFILARTCMAAMGKDKDHEENWLGCEIDLYAYSRTESPVAIPMDMKGLVDLGRLKQAIDGRE